MAGKDVSRRIDGSAPGSLVKLIKLGWTNIMNARYSKPKISPG